MSTHKFQANDIVTFHNFLPIKALSHSVKKPSSLFISHGLQTVQLKSKLLMLCSNPVEVNNQLISARITSRGLGKLELRNLIGRSLSLVDLHWYTTNKQERATHNRYSSSYMIRQWTVAEN